MNRTAKGFLRFLAWTAAGVLALVICLVLAVTLNDHRGSRPWLKTPFPEISDWDSLKITLGREGCLGSCPIYQVSIDGRGNVIFDGYNSSFAPVRHTYQVSQRSVHELFFAFQKAEFFWLYDEYAVGATDLPRHKVSISFDGHKKEVIDYLGRSVGMPKEVTELEAMIDRVAGTKKLLTVGGDAVPPIKTVQPPRPVLIAPTIPKMGAPEIRVEEPGKTP